MKLEHRIFNNTDCYIFTAKPEEGKLVLVTGNKKTVKEHRHAWMEDKESMKPVCKINGGYFGATRQGGMSFGEQNWGGWSVDKKYCTLILENNQLFADVRYDFGELRVSHPNSDFMRQLGDLLVIGGRKTEKYNFDHSKSRNPRTFIGQKKNGQFVMFASDGRTDKGFTISELADIAIELGCHIAMNCDGGGSSTMMIENEMVNTNDNRAVFDAFIFYATDYTLERTEHVEMANTKPDRHSELLDEHITKNFTYRELSCNDHDEIYLTKEVFGHAERLQKLRDYMGIPLKVNSWYRTPSYNKKVDGASTSQHLYGIATDIAIGKGATQEKAIKKWLELCNADGLGGGVGRYTNFVHLDSRKVHSTW